ncbi:hypothetical protein KAJ89_01650 [Candidatus Parcubacteria bacterium]|nr:hypothetical protein [Candidatus Parcubacteria bacterium]
MFEKIQKKPDDKKKKKPMPGNIPRRPVSLPAKFAMSEDTNNSKKNKPSKEFENRMRSLYEKGKKRGFRYSVIGISYCIIVAIVVLSLGYFLTKEIKEITKQVYDVELTPLEAILDPGNKICDLDYCCLASLKRIHKHNYEIYDREKRCKEGYERKSLECENSLAWCEPIEGFVINNNEKINDNDIKITNPDNDI